MTIKKDHVSYIAICLLVAAVALAAFFGQKPKTPAPPITIGALFPLTGKFANFGQDSKNGAKLALEEAQAQGLNLNIIYEDSAADPKVAVLGADKLINADKVAVVLGSLGSSANLAVAPLMQQSRKLFVVVSANPKLKESGDYVFKLHPDVDGEIKQMMQFIVGKNFKKIAVIFDSASDTTTTAKDIFTKLFNQVGGKVAAEGFDSKTTTDFRSILSKLQSIKPDALYILSVDQPAGVIVKQAKELNFNPALLGWSGLVSQQFIDIAGASADGLISTDYVFSCDGTQLMKGYCKKYKDKFNNASPTEYGAHIYDAINILSGLIKEFGADTEKIRKGLLGLKNYQGVSGEITFDGKRYVEGKDFVFRQVKAGQFVDLNK